MTGALTEQSSGASPRARKAHVYSGQSAKAFLRRWPRREEAPATQRTGRKLLKVQEHHVKANSRSWHMWGTENRLHCAWCMVSKGTLYSVRQERGPTSLYGHDKESEFCSKFSVYWEAMTRLYLKWASWSDLHFKKMTKWREGAKWEIREEEIVIIQVRDYGGLDDGGGRVKRSGRMRDWRGKLWMDG